MVKITNRRSDLFRLFKCDIFLPSKSQWIYLAPVCQLELNTVNRGNERMNEWLSEWEM